jgi:hypothetical protein
MIPDRRPIPITTRILLASVFLLGPSLAVATALATPGIIAGALADDALARYEYFSRSALAGYDSLATRKDSTCGRHFAGIIAEERAGWGERWDSNPQPPGPQPGALTN